MRESEDAALKPPLAHCDLEQITVTYLRYVATGRVREPINNDKIPSRGLGGVRQALHKGDLLPLLLLLLLLLCLSVSHAWRQPPHSRSPRSGGERSGRGQSGRVT